MALNTDKRSHSYHAGNTIRWGTTIPGIQTDRKTRARGGIAGQTERRTASGNQEPKERDCVRSRRQIQKENYLRRKNVHRESRCRRKAAGLRAAAWTRIETGAGRIHPDEFRRR